MQAYHIPSDYFEAHWRMSDWVRLLAVMGEKPSQPRRGIPLSEWMGGAK